MDGVIVRNATPGDTVRIAEIISGEPGTEAVAIAGSEEAARKFGMALVRLPDSPQGWAHSTVAEFDGRVVGVVQAAQDLSFKVTLRLAWLALETFGLGLISVWPRYQARQRVEPKVPAGSWYIGELDVDPQHQNRGIGGALLDDTEREARNRGLQMSLQTTTVNPARRLYERHGFRVVETKTDPSYERITGIPGRHLMVKELA